MRPYTRAPHRTFGMRVTHMKYIFGCASALALTAGSAFAGGIERGSINYGLLFQPGNQIELSFSTVRPNVTGDYSATTASAAALTGVGVGVASTGNMASNYSSIGFGYKNDLTDKLSFGLFVNQPYGADAAYTAGFYTGLTAQWDSNQIATMLRYQVLDRVSVYGGVRYVRSTADITIPGQMIKSTTLSSLNTGLAQANDAIAQLTAAGVPATDPRLVGAQAALARVNGQLTTLVPLPNAAFQYDASGDMDGRWGYVLGAAYEIPDIALRVGLTWESSITHEFDTTENLPALGLNLGSTTEVEMPQSVALDFQTGVAAGTLVFGQVKWTEWSKWEVRPAGYEGITGGNVTGFDNDTITWKLGVGRQFSEAWSGFAQITYEKANGGLASRLAPTDGRISLGIGGQFTQDNMKIRGGIEYAKVGDATDASGVAFKGNDVLGFGVSMTFGF